MRPPKLSILVALCAGFLGASAIANDVQPTTQAYIFYHWYLDRSDAAQPTLMQAKIENFVAPELVKNLRSIYKANGFADGTDYFLKVQDYDRNDWKKHITISPPIPSGNQILERVTLGSAGSVGLCIHFKKVDSVWKISSVDEPNLKTAPEDCRTHITEEAGPQRPLF